MFGADPRVRPSYLLGQQPRWAGGGSSILDSDPNYPKCTIRLPFEGADTSTSILDAMGNAWTAFGNAQLSTTSPLVGASSLLLDGAGDYCGATVASAIGTGDFTIRAKIKPVNLTNDGEIFCISDAGGTLTNFNIVFEYKTTGAIRFSIQTGTSGGINADVSSTTGVIVAGNTYDVEACADGSTARIYVDGVQVASVAITGTRANSRSDVRTGFLTTASGVTRYINGRVDNLIIYAGVCLHPGGTTFTPDSSIPALAIPRFTSRFTTGSSGIAQGVATDGLFVWFSSDNTIYKYTMAGALLASRNVMTDAPTDKQQINGLFIKDNLLRVSCAKFSGGVATSWIADYHPDALTYIRHRQLVGDWFAEGVCWHRDAWWVAFHAHKVVARYTALWVPAGTYALSFPTSGDSGGFGGTQGYDGLFWKDSYLWLAIHLIYDQDYWDVYYFANGAMNQAARIARPTTGAHQGICLDPTAPSKVWAAERNAAGGDSVALLTVS